MKKEKRVKYQNRFVPLRKLAAELDIPFSTLNHRYCKGIRGVALCSSTSLRRGKVCKAPKLTNDQVLDIYSMAHATHFNQYQIAELYGIHQSTVSDIKLGRRWNNLTKHTLKHKVK